MAIARGVQWHVWLVDSEPPIWRRFQTSDQATLRELHEVLQRVMGWQDAHLHAFEWKANRYAPVQFGLDDTQDTQATTLADFKLQVGAELTYTYDFGDGWLHLLTVEALPELDAGNHLPRCLEGDRACPPEDCGGIWGYEELLERLADPEDPDYEDLLTWIGPDFDPEVFDVDAVNQQLRG